MKHVHRAGWFAPRYPRGPFRRGTVTLSRRPASLFPMDADAWLVRLNMVRGLEPRPLAGLLARFGSARRALAAPAEAWREVDGVTADLVAELRQAARDGPADGEVAAAAAAGLSLVARGAADYPLGLGFLSDPPPLLYVRGELRPDDALAVGIVGARRCTHFGLRQAARFAGALAAAGVTIVSGLARGIDGRAHEAALAAGGRTIAVLGGGLDRIYPPEHRPLAARVAASGALLSEFPLGAPPLRHHFPRRNRIIAGLGWGLLVVEAAGRSGSLITARLAMEAGREVFAVPGPVDSELSAGAHQLIRDGASLVESPGEILEDLGLAPASGEPVGPPAPPAPQHPVARRVLAAFPETGEPLHPDQIVAATDLDVADVLAACATLTLVGHHDEEPGGRFRRAR